MSKKFDGEWETIKDLVEQKAKKNKGKVLMYYEDRSVTYDEVNEKANIVADRLLRLDIKKGDRICSLLHNIPETLFIWFGLAKIGAIWTPINISLRGDDLLYTLDDAEPRIIFVENELINNYNQIKKMLKKKPTEIYVGAGQMLDKEILSFESLLSEGGRSVAPTITLRPDDPATIVYTSGTTGMPKGVVIPQFSHINAGLRFLERLEPKVNDCYFSVLQLYHIAHQLMVIGPMVSDISFATVKWFSASRYWDQIRRYNATIIDCFGSVAQILFKQEAKENDGNNPARIALGPESQTPLEIRRAFEARFKLKFNSVYAMTETGVLAFVNTSGRPEKENSIGTPSRGVEVQIVDEFDRSLPTGEQGQIVVRPTIPNTMMIEYYKKPENTLNRFRNLWFHSGDYGFLDDEGFLYFSAREEHRIRRRGELISAFEVEKIINEHSKVEECAVVGIPDEIGEEVKVYVKIKPGKTLDPIELIQWCEEKMAYFKVPRYVEFIESFPRTVTTNRIQRHKLKEIGVGDSWDREKSGYKLRR
jgi:crotonobetaine/carnitine-CoA ligase